MVGTKPLLREGSCSFLALLYLTWAALGSPTNCSHSGLRHVTLPHASKPNPLPLNSDPVSCNHLLDWWNLGEINPPGLRQDSPKTALLLSPMHLWGWAVLWLRMPSRTIHHTVAQVTRQELFAGINGLTAGRQEAWFGAGLMLTGSIKPSFAKTPHVAGSVSVQRLGLERCYYEEVICLITKWCILSCLVTASWK